MVKMIKLILKFFQSNIKIFLKQIYEPVIKDFIKRYWEYYYAFNN